MTYYGMAKKFREWDTDQVWLLPPSLLEFVPPDHEAHFTRDTVSGLLDLSEIYDSYEEGQGQPPFHGSRARAVQDQARGKKVFRYRRRPNATLRTPRVES